MSKAKKMNLASIKKQMEALKEAQVQEEQRIKENIAKGLTSDVVEKLDCCAFFQPQYLSDLRSGLIRNIDNGPLNCFGRDKKTVHRS